MEFNFKIKNCGIDQQKAELDKESTSLKNRIEAFKAVFAKTPFSLMTVNEARARLAE